MGVMTRLACIRAQEEGVEVAPLLRNAGLTQEQIDDPGARLDVRRQIKFLDFVAAELDDELLGFHLAQKYDLRMIGLLYYTQASSESIGEALRRGARYSSIVNEGIARQRRRPWRQTCWRRRPRPTNDAPRRTAPSGRISRPTRPRTGPRASARDRLGRARIGLRRRSLCRGSAARQRPAPAAARAASPQARSRSDCSR